MSKFQPISIESAPRLINHGPTILITSRSKDGKIQNVMTAAWNSPVEFEPPRLVVLINKESLTRKLVLESGIFGICIPSASFVNETYSIGHSTGREINKFAMYGIETVQSPSLNLPVIEKGCIAWMECKLIPEADVQEKYDTFFAEVVSASADPEIFYENRYHFTESNKALHTIHHLGGGNFAIAGELVSAEKI